MSADLKSWGHPARVQRKGATANKGRPLSPPGAFRWPNQNGNRNPGSSGMQSREGKATSPSWHRIEDGLAKGEKQRTDPLTED